MYAQMNPTEGHKALNLSLPAELVKLMKIHCIEQDTDVSAITESLYAQYLKDHGVKVPPLPKRKRGTERIAPFIGSIASLWPFILQAT
jgi:hypothetical protein